MRFVRGPPMGSIFDPATTTLFTFTRWLAGRLALLERVKVVRVASAPAVNEHLASLRMSIVCVSRNHRTAGFNHDRETARIYRLTLRLALLLRLEVIGVAAAPTDRRPIRRVYHSKRPSRHSGRRGPYPSPGHECERSNPQTRDRDGDLILRSHVLPFSPSWSGRNADLASFRERPIDRM